MRNNHHAKKNTTENIRKNKYEKLLADGYVEMSDESLKIMKEFQALDREALKYIV